MINKSDFNNQSELFDFLRTNKKRLIAEKCFKPQKHYSTYPVFENIQKSESTTKAKEDDKEENSSIKKSIVGNTFNWCDSQDDVLFKGCATKTIQENGVHGKDLIYHLHDHKTNTTNRIGYLEDIYEKDFTLKELGYDYNMSTTCLVFDSNIKKELNENLYIQYRDKKVKQHSIGLRYVKILLCINDEKDAEHYKNWVTYSSFVINQEKIIKNGFFWAVTEIQLYEVSAVLWGANEVSPTIEEIEETKNIEPLENTQKEEPTEVTQKRSVSEMIASKKIIINI